MSAKMAYYAAMLLMTALLMVGGSYIFEHYLVKKGIVYNPPLADGYEDYLLKRDPLLGWPPVESKDRDPSGSRIIPSFPNHNNQSCVSLYGDSFTWGAEVDNESAWGNILSKLLNCRISNFGVGGYGTDQAYLRFKHKDVDRAKIVILGYLSENNVRNMTQYFYFLYPNSDWIRYSLKPRFIINEDGSLSLIPLLKLSLNEFRKKG